MGCQSGTAAQRVVSGRKFCSRQGLENIELVTVWVGHDHLSDVALADAHPPRSQPFEPGDLRELVGWAKVELQPVLDGFSLRHLEEDEVWRDAVLGTADRWLEADLLLALPDTAPAKRSSPEVGDSCRVGGIDAQTLDANLHLPILFWGAQQVPVICAGGSLIGLCLQSD